MFGIENAQDVKNVIETLCPNEALEITDKDGVSFLVRKCERTEGYAVFIGSFSFYCSDIQVWNDSILRFNDEMMHLGTLRNIDQMAFAVKSVEE